MSRQHALLDNDTTNKIYVDSLFNAIRDDHVNDIASLRKAIDETNIKITTKKRHKQNY